MSRTFESIVLALINSINLDAIENENSTSILGSLPEYETEKEDLHRTLYRLYTLDIALPWEVSHKNIGHPFLLKIRRELEKRWDDSLKDKYKDTLANLPDTEGFSAWAMKTVRSSTSGATHPLFTFLRDEASYEQIREFVRQESPFDMHFSDIVVPLIPGLYGEIRMEIAGNFWDEAGRGTAKRTHRRMRGNLLDRFGIEMNDHLERPETYCWEELAMANTFFKYSFNRNKLVEAIGALYSTELAVPGRMADLFQGCLRVGLTEKEAKYVSDHITIDAEHAIGWENAVVTPIIKENPATIPNMALGIIARLDVAELVCDMMLPLLKANELETNLSL